MRSVYVPCKERTYIARLGGVTAEYFPHSIQEVSLRLHKKYHQLSSKHPLSPFLHTHTLSIIKDGLSFQFIVELPNLAIVRSIRVSIERRQRFDVSKPLIHVNSSNGSPPRCRDYDELKEIEMEM